MTDRGYESPGVGYQEVEEVVQNTAVDTLGVGIVGGATKGPLDRVQCHSAKEVIALFGYPTERDFGLLAACKLADVSNKVYFQRVVDSSAAVSKAGTDEDIYKLETNDYNSEMNGTIAAFSYTATGVTVKLIRNGNVLQEIGECTYDDPDAETDFVKIFNKRNKYNIKAVRTSQALPDVDAQKASLAKTCIIDSTALVEEDYRAAIKVNDGEAVEVTIGELPESLATLQTTINNALNGATISFVAKEGKAVDIVLETTETGASKSVEIVPTVEGHDLFDAIGFTGRAVGIDENHIPANVNLQFAGGNDGISNLKATDIIGQGKTAGLTAFADPEGVDVSMIICPGWHASQVTAFGKKAAEDRGDAEFYPDCPQGLYPDDVVDFVNAQGNFDSSYKFDSGFIAAFYPWVEEYNVYLGKKIFLPPSIWVAYAILLSDKVNYPWLAVAGEKRGILKGATATERPLPKEIRDKLYTNFINPIVDFGSGSILIYGNRTCRRTSITEEEAPTAFLNVRRMANYCRKCVIRETRSYIFDQNGPTMWRRWTRAISKKLKYIKDGEGIEKYIVKMDESTVSEADKRNGRAPGKIFVKPVRAAEWFPISFTLTDNEVYFQDEDYETTLSDEEVAALTV